MKSILFLGAGELGMSNLIWAHELGFNVIVNDIKSDAPGLKLADQTLNFDSQDAEGLKEWVVLHNAELNIRYCHCGSDFGLKTSAIIHEALELNFPGLSVIENGLDKSKMKQCWSSVDIKYPKSQIVSVSHSSQYNFEYPLVVKPLDSCGSQGVSIVSESWKLGEALTEAGKYSPDSQVIVEAFIAGSHHDVNGLFWHDRFYPAGLGDRYFLEGDHPVPLHGYYPSAIVPELQKECYRILEMGGRSMGITHGPVKADLIWDGTDLLVLEISPRFHGDIFSSKVMGFLMKLNPLYQLFNLIWSDSETFKQLPDGMGHGAWKMMGDTTDIQYPKQLAGIFVKNKGTRSLIKVKNNAEIGGLVWAHGPDRVYLDRILQIEKVTNHE